MAKPVPPNLEGGITLNYRSYYDAESGDVTIEGAGGDMASGVAPASGATANMAVHGGNVATMSAVSNAISGAVEDLSGEGGEGAATTFVTTGGDQTITGTKTFTPSQIFSGGATFSDAVEVTVNGVNITANGEVLNLRNASGGGSIRATFSTHVTDTDQQIGYMEYSHLDASSFGSNESFIFGGNQPSITVLADGKLMYRDGIYKKPASGTGAGTRKDANWDTAYGWGNHADGGYLTVVPPGDAPVRATELAPNANLDELAQQEDAGFYNQRANADTPGNNYPVELAGSLLVQKSADAGGYGTTQLYITYNNADVYVRPMYGSGSTNNPWHQIWTSRNITPTSISNWNTAYAWGDHSTAGYADGTNVPNWDQAYAWGDHANAGYFDPTNNLLLVCTDGIEGGSSNSWPLQIRQDTGGKDAMMSFHVSGDYAVNFGLDGGTNKLTVGGWSMGSNMYPIYHAGNPPEKVTVTTATGDWFDILAHSGGTVYADTACHIHGSGYIQASYFNATHDVSTRNSDTTFYSSNDNYIRKNNASGLRTSLNVYSKTEADGKYVRTDVNTDVSAHIEMQDNYEMRFGNSADVRMDFNGTDFYCRSYSHGARFLFQGERTSDGSNRALLYLDPDGEAGIYHSGAKKGYTYSSGWRVSGNLLATSDVYAYYSDVRLKDVVGTIDNPVDKVKSIETFFYTHNDTARELGYEGAERQIGVSAQSVKEVLPEVIHRAPIDEDGEGGSVTGEDYMTVDYPRLVPLLIESIKQLSEEIDELKEKLNAL